jgi:hypothetical protein
MQVVFVPERESASPVRASSAERPREGRLS